MKTLNQVLTTLIFILVAHSFSYGQIRSTRTTKTTTTTIPTTSPKYVAPAISSGWIARHNMSASKYQSEFNLHKSKGYRLVQIRGYAVNGQHRFVALWEKKTGPLMKTHHGMTAAVYQQKFTSYANAGYRLSHLSAYDVRGVDYYAAIWEKKSGPAWVGKHRMTSAQYQQEYNSRKAQGYRLVQVTGYAIQGSARFAAIWEKKSGPLLKTHHIMSSAVYQQKFNAYSGQGYRLTGLSGYTIKGKDYYAAIWEKKAGAAQSARHRMSATNYQQAFDNHKYTGYKPYLFTGYTRGGKPQYAAVWTAGQMKVSDLQAIRNRVQSFMNEHNIPGVQVAVSRNEKLVFARGYGKADVENNVDMGPHLKGRIASISKPITAAAILKLNAMNNTFNLNSSVIGNGSIFGNEYGMKAFYSDAEKNIRVAHLLEHTAGSNAWDNNDFQDHTGDTDIKEVNITGDPMFLWQTDSRKVLFGKILNQRNPERAPGTYYAYSNFGYSMLGRIIEKKTGQSYETWVRNHILKPAKAGGMFVSNNTRAQKRSNEMVYYGQGSNAYAANVKRMDSHGGWAGSVIDLLNFMARVDGGNGKADILPANIINNMKSSTSYVNNPEFQWNYGKGWALLGGGGVNHAGALSGTFSVLEYKSNGIAVAIIINSNAGDQDFQNDFFALKDQVINAITKWPSYDLF